MLQISKDSSRNHLLGLATHTTNLNTIPSNITLATITEPTRNNISGTKELTPITAGLTPLAIIKYGMIFHERHATKDGLMHRLRSYTKRVLESRGASKLKLKILKIKECINNWNQRFEAYEQEVLSNP